MKACFALDKGMSSNCAHLGAAQNRQAVSGDPDPAHTFLRQQTLWSIDCGWQSLLLHPGSSLYSAPPSQPCKAALTVSSPVLRSNISNLGTSLSIETMKLEDSDVECHSCRLICHTWKIRLASGVNADNIARVSPNLQDPLACAS